VARALLRKSRTARRSRADFGRSHRTRKTKIRRATLLRRNSRRPRGTRSRARLPREILRRPLALADLLAHRPNHGRAAQRAALPRFIEARRPSCSECALTSSITALTILVFAFS